MEYGGGLCSGSVSELELLVCVKLGGRGVDVGCAGGRGALRRRIVRKKRDTSQLSRTTWRSQRTRPSL
jgi:hypothetical protein